MSIGEETSNAAREALMSSFARDPILDTPTVLEKAMADLHKARKALADSQYNLLIENANLRAGLKHVLAGRFVLVESPLGGLRFGTTPQSPKAFDIQVTDDVRVLLFEVLREIELEAEHAR